MIKCIILEDEKPAQNVLKSYIERVDFLLLLGVYESGLDISTDHLEQADLLFLDFQLPELNGLSFLKTLTNPPYVIFTTAFSNHAIEAYEEAVLDYLVKPFSYERFLKAVNRVKDIEDMKADKPQDEVVLYADKTKYKIAANDIFYLKAEVDYVRVVTCEKQILVLDSLKNFRERLKAKGFIQIHRSYIANISKVEKYSADQVTVGDYSIPIGKTYKEELLRKLNF